ncbi:hypothetical protein N7533_013742 [Penicillium manginii]|uniref:uncharacterized protein n=1 Tax=Penicillium manginii TaxID=203109 RepID=UPI0025495748|nr:uncharacterized protein N7533_013742 [Penicillium manginii]KAJ5733295.1 hypothetical protein N7533_013742 [Penicillium manginii]
MALKILSRIARKAGLIRVSITVVRHTRGHTRVIHSIWPSDDYEILPTQEEFAEECKQRDG